MNSKNIILVCTHKNVILDLPNLYKPIIGGHKLNKLDYPDFLKDDEGDNISEKNPFYSELTALYWGYKNLGCNHLGLVHYRRYFKGKEKATINGKKISVLSDEEVNRYLSKFEVIVPKKRYYIIESVYSHYCRTLKSEPIIVLEKIIYAKYPEYITEFNNLKIRRSAHMFNMMVGTRDFVNNYLNFLFDILFELEKNIDTTSWNSYQKRYLGAISELIFDMYIRKNKISYKEIKYIQLIPFHGVAKIFKYLKSFFTKEKYSKSD